MKRRWFVGEQIKGGEQIKHCAINMTQSLIHPPEKADTPGWLRPTVEKLSQLLSLPANWDSYGARAIAGQLSWRRYGYWRM